MLSSLHFMTSGVRHPSDSPHAAYASQLGLQPAGLHCYSAAIISDIGPKNADDRMMTAKAARKTQESVGE